MTAQTKYKTGAALLEAVTPFLERGIEPPRLRYIKPRAGSITQFEPYWALYASAYDVSHCGARALPLHVDDAAAIWRDYLIAWAVEKGAVVERVILGWPGPCGKPEYHSTDLINAIAAVIVNEETP